MKISAIIAVVIGMWLSMNCFASYSTSKEAQKVCGKQGVHYDNSSKRFFCGMKYSPFAQISR